MTFDKLLKKKGFTIYKLSNKSSIPYSTLNDICNDKTKIKTCSGLTLYKLSKALDITMEDLIEEENIQEERERSFEYNLPTFLQHDLDEYKKGIKEHSHLLDCLWCELYASINIAEINDQIITKEHADYLRNKFLF